MTAANRNMSRSSTWPDVSLLVASVAVASGIELLILRAFTRTAIHIPAMHQLQGPYDVVSATGQYLYFAAVVLVAGTVAALLTQLFRHQIPARHLVLFGILLFALPAAVASVARSNSLALGLGTIAAVSMVGVAVVVTGTRRWSNIPVASFVVAFAAGGVYTTVPALTSVEIRFEQPTWLLNISEYLGVAFAVTSPLLLRGSIDRRARWTGVVVGLLVLLIFVGSGSTSRFLLLWNIGLSGILPGVAYAAAAGLLATTVTAMARQGMFIAASGLVLLVTGGIGLHSTYQSALVMAGLVALFCGMWMEAGPNDQEDDGRKVAPGPSKL